MWCGVDRLSAVAAVFNSGIEHQYTCIHSSSYCPLQQQSSFVALPHCCCCNPAALNQERGEVAGELNKSKALTADLQQQLEQKEAAIGELQQQVAAGAAEKEQLIKEAEEARTKLAAEIEQLNSAQVWWAACFCHYARWLESCRCMGISVRTVTVPRTVTVWWYG